MWNVVLDALLDGLKILPFILLIYILMEVLENTRKKESIERILAGPFAPVFAGALGAVPECGFAVMCAKLFDKGLIKTGTLIAAFISVSDEGVIILLSGGKVTAALILTAVKIVYAIIVGEILNFVFFKREHEHVCPDKDDCIECGEHHEKAIDKYFLHPLYHTLKTFIYLFIINIALGFIIYFLGEENITEFMHKSLYVQPLITGLVGLIPNCGSSIILAQGYTESLISFSGLIAGLSANAGIGILLLLKSKKSVKKAFAVMGIQYVFAIVLGYITLAFTVIFA